jgi:hypothetical protein
MKAVVLRLSESIPLAVENIDISADPDLDRQYGLEIPVLVIDGRKAAKYRVTEESLRRMLANRPATLP